MVPDGGGSPDPQLGAETAERLSVEERLALALQLSTARLLNGERLAHLLRLALLALEVRDDRALGLAGEDVHMNLALLAETPASTIFCAPSKPRRVD